MCVMKITPIPFVFACTIYFRTTAASFTPSAEVGSSRIPLQHPLLFELSEIFPNCYLADVENTGQLLDLDVPLLFEELQNFSTASRGDHNIRWRYFFSGCGL